MSFYRAPSVLQPLPPDPDLELYAAIARKQRRRAFGAVIAIASVAAAIVVAIIVARALRERRLAHRWRDALECFDSAELDGLDARIRARELRAVDEGGERSWPVRCAGALRDVVHAADAAGDRALTSAASEVAEIAERWDRKHEDLVFPAWKMAEAGRQSGLVPVRMEDAPPAPTRLPRVNELETLKTDGECTFADDGRSATCGRSGPRPFDPLTIGDARIRRFDAESWYGSAALRPPRSDHDDAFGSDGLVIESCDAHGCIEEAAGIGDRPAVIVTGRLATKVVVVWIDAGAVGGVRMRIAKPGGLAASKTRIIFDDWRPWPRAADDGPRPRGFATTPIRRLHVIERAGFALVFFEAQNVFVARIDDEGNVTSVPVNSDASVRIE